MGKALGFRSVKADDLQGPAQGHSHRGIALEEAFPERVDFGGEGGDGGLETLDRIGVGGFQRGAFGCPVHFLVSLPVFDDGFHFLADQSGRLVLVGLDVARAVIAGQVILVRHAFVLFAGSSTEQHRGEQEDGKYLFHGYVSLTLGKRVPQAFDPAAQLTVLFGQFGDAVVEFLELVVPFEGIVVLGVEGTVTVKSLQHLVDRIDVIGQDVEQQEQDQHQSDGDGDGAGNDAPVETAFESSGVLLQLLVNGGIEIVDISMEPVVDRLQPLEIPGPRIDEVGEDDVRQFQRGQHIGGPGIDDGIGQMLHVDGTQRDMEAVAVIQERLPVEVRQFVVVFVADDGQDLQVVGVRDVGELLGGVDALDVVRNQVGDIIAHAPVFEDRKDAGDEKNDGDGTEAERYLHPQGQPEIPYPLS